MEIAFRLDASRAIGLGHLSRSSNLALALARRGVRSVFLVGGEGGHQLARARLSGEISRWVTVEPADVTGSAADLEATLARAASASWIVVDHYGLSSSFLARLGSGAARLCVIDDLGDRDLRMADLVVNTTPAAAMVEYPPELEPKLLTGDYVLLHPAFVAERRGARARSGPPSRVLVSFGGTDAASLLPSALVVLRDRLPGAALRAVLGVAGDEQGPTHGETRLRAQPPEAMAAHMAWAELAIATPSTIAWELAAVGTPAILCHVFENQTPTARYFRELGAFPVLEGVRGLGEALEDVGGLPQEELARRTRIFASSCDGLGATRLAERLASGGR